MNEMKSSVCLVAGIFLSLSIISAVLACALWDFTQHVAFENTIYGTGLLGSFLLNIGICFSLLRAVNTQTSQLFLPYIVCSFFHLIISIVFTGVFTVSSIRSIISGSDVTDLIGVFVFAVCSVFWCWSMNVVVQYRKVVKKLSGEHELFTNPEFI